MTGKTATTNHRKMITVRSVKNSGAFFSLLPIFTVTTTTTNHTIFLFYSTTPTSSYSSSYKFLPPSSTTLSPSIPGTPQLQASDVVLSFKEWFKTSSCALLSQIYKILAAQDESALCRLKLRLCEALVLEVLNYGKDVLSCLKFFDWAGRQPGFYHTRSTFNAIFKILSREKLMSIMVGFLENYMKQRYVHRVRFYNTLVMGYAIAGKPEYALQLFGRMRFQGIDLDGFSYHVLLNALVEDGYFDAVEMVAKQIRIRNFESDITCSILVKSFCKQQELDRAEEYLRGVVGNGLALNGHVVGVVVDALCKNNQFEKAGKLVEEFRKMGIVPMEHAYGVWIRRLVQAGKLDGALEFLKCKKLVDGYVPDVFKYNMLICRLLRENRLEEVCDLLIEMKDLQIVPDNVTMNAALCFFCKAGMEDVALELYDSRAEFGLSPNYMAYNYLINTLCGDESVDVAFRVLRDSIEHCYFPRRKTFSILVNALCRAEKLEKMNEMFLVALERNFMPSDSTYDKFISALCRARRVEDGYLLHGQLNGLNKVSSKSTYFNLINGFNMSGRGDIAARLLIEMQEKGHNPTKKLFRAVIYSLSEMENPEKQFLRLLEMQLSHHEPNPMVYNLFIDGAGHAKKPELAREVYEMMKRSDIEPNLSSDILVLQSYLKSEKIADALNFFHDLSRRRKIGRKLYNTIIVGLCKANKPHYAADILLEMRTNHLKPSLECYEVLVQLLCAHQEYYMVVNLVEDLINIGRPVSSFIGNVLLLHSLKTEELFGAWARSIDVHNLTPSSLMLGELIGAFSGCKAGKDIEIIGELIERCFPLDIYTYNMLLRRLCMSDMDHACKFFKKLCEKGYEPNRWTYDTLVHGFFRHGRTTEARRWMDEMFGRGFDLTDATKKFT
ncbi:unnamed protein product [Ilex paraguariensis]|uniref:Pentatricopeptide repeat-containing protein n=1 Tax=Ilex paraguariensis TaxID=185542 RepID=A0ABC8TP63_9AQUA